jgi:hypothetical protein
MKIWWILGGIFLFARKPAAVSTPPGGMNPVQPMSDAIGRAIDAGTGQQVSVVGPLPTTVVGQITAGTSFAIDASDEAFLAMPQLNATVATAGPAQVPMFQNPDTLPGAWPGLAAAPTPAPSSPAQPAPPLFDLNADSFLVPGFGEEDFSPGVLSPDEKLAILRSQGYTGPDPRQVATTPLAAAQDANPAISPVTGRVMLPNV